MKRIAVALVATTALLALAPTGAHAAAPQGSCHTTVKHKNITIDGVAGVQTWYTERCRDQAVTRWAIWAPR